MPGAMESVATDGRPGRVFSCMLRDGARVRVRPLRPGDEPALARFVADLSPDSLRRRFLGSLDPDRAMQALSRTSSPSDCVLVVERAMSATIIGHAACFATADDRAEAAFLVADAWQGRGLGSLLLSCLADAALQGGFSWLIADVLPHNRGMLRVFERSGHPVDVSSGSHALRVELHIEPPAHSLRRAA